MGILNPSTKPLNPNRLDVFVIMNLKSFIKSFNPNAIKRNRKKINEKDTLF